MGFRDRGKGKPNTAEAGADAGSAELRMAGMGVASVLAAP
jgi:hypothetical protein